MKLCWADGEPLTDADADRDALCDADLQRKPGGKRVDMLRFLRSVVLVRDDAWDHVHGDACDAPECCPNDNGVRSGQAPGMAPPGLPAGTGTPGRLPPRPERRR